MSWYLLRKLQESEEVMSAANDACAVYHGDSSAYGACR